MTNKNYSKEAVVFDLDNTLIDSGSKLSADVRGTFARLGYQLNADQKIGDGYTLAQSYGISKDEFDKEFDKRKTWQESLRDGEVAIFPETYRVLEQLKQRGNRISLLSKSIPEYTDVKVNHFGLGKYFEQILTVHPREPSKDKGAIEIVRAMKPETIESAYFIGDKEEDVVAEKAVANEFKDYKMTTGGIYVNRNGGTLNGYPSVNSLEGILSVI